MRIMQLTMPSLEDFRSIDLWGITLKKFQKSVPLLGVGFCVS